MKPAQREYIKYLQDCRLPELRNAQVTSEGQRETALEIEQLIRICEDIDEVAEASVKRAALAEKGRKW